MSSSRRTLIRKTSLLHKIDPTALRSSFADICIACTNIPARLSPAEVPDRRKCLEIARRVTASQPRLALGSISSSRCQTSRAPRPKPRTHGFKIFTNEFECWLHQIGGAVWWSQTGSNRRPPACKAGALPTELWPRRDQASVIGNQTSEAAHAPRLITDR